MWAFCNVHFGVSLSASRMTQHYYTDTHERIVIFYYFHFVSIRYRGLPNWTNGIVSFGTNFWCRRVFLAHTRRAHVSIICYCFKRWTLNCTAYAAQHWAPSLRLRERKNSFSTNKFLCHLPVNRWMHPRFTFSSSMAFSFYFRIKSCFRRS